MSLTGYVDWVSQTIPELKPHLWSRVGYRYGVPSKYSGEIGGEVWGSGQRSKEAAHWPLTTFRVGSPSPCSRPSEKMGECGSGRVRIQSSRRWA
jgi:hypothetical protein